ncbi:MAG: 50S ribosomal protein L19 [Terrimicrobiaceae bacterium]
MERKGAVRRAKLNYLRLRKGKSATTVKDRAERA